jgi:hypothetical protein
MIDAYRQGYQEFNAELMRESYLYNSGQKMELEIAPIYERYAHLFDSEAVSRLKGILEKTPEHFAGQRASIKHFLVFAVNQLLDSSVKSLTEEISRDEAAAATGWRGRKMTFQDSAVAISTEAVRASRDQIYNWRLSIIAASNDLRVERIEKLHQAASLIGGPLPEGSPDSPRTGRTGQSPELDRDISDSRPDRGRGQGSSSSYSALYKNLYQLDLDSIASQCESLLARTESVYVARLDEALRSDLGISVDEATRPDGMYLMHLPRYDGRFPPDRIMTAYHGTMEGLGIRTEYQSNILIDDEPRPHKSPRAFCAPIRVPEEVRLVIRPFGGHADYISFLHEAGHAQHYGWTAAGLPSEFKYTGDSALTETYAFLFNHLPSDPVWLETFLGFAGAGDFIKSSILTRLFTVRRYAGKFIFELGLHSGTAHGDAGRAYSEVLSEATGFKTGEAEYLFDMDDAFYSAGYLRAWAFEVVLRDYLITRFGKLWWTNTRAGTFLKELWETGDRYTADEIASQIGIGPINFDLLTDDFLKALA